MLSNELIEYFVIVSLGKGVYIVHLRVNRMMHLQCSALIVNLYSYTVSKIGQPRHPFSVILGLVYS